MSDNLIWYCRVPFLPNWTAASPSVRSCCWHSHICLFQLGGHEEDAEPRLMVKCRRLGPRSDLLNVAQAEKLRLNCGYAYVEQLAPRLEWEAEEKEEAMISSHPVLRDRWNLISGDTSRMGRTHLQSC
ncbi:hypothetical protein CRENBAI_003164 [Crenichthys baileyi]|uniref:Uncharacterized protein n=1 Tax=Crenichthys baileyi TaxID=28760 RepID=A0AAV9RZM6_9TELE